MRRFNDGTYFSGVWIMYQVENVANVLPKDCLRQLQMIELEILLEVDRICKKHDIKYSLAAGTLLGAVRHKGFIPWDDDLDLIMLRKEYDRFCKVCEEELDNNKFYLQTHQNTPGYRWGYAKMRRHGTEYIRKGQEHLQYASGVSIDIFPLDSVPDSRIFKPVYHFACFITRKLLWSEAGKRSETNPIKRWVYWIMSMVPKDTVFRLLYDRLVNCCGDRLTEQVRVITRPYKRHAEGWQRKWLMNLRQFEFEGFLFPGPVDYHKYLISKYGDYMQLPPAEHQKGHHQALSYQLIDIRFEDLVQYEREHDDLKEQS